MAEVKVVTVETVEGFPDRDDLNINRLSNGAVCVSNREVAGGASRYQPGDLVIHVPEGLIVPDWLLKRQDCWDDAKGKGRLGGSKGNRVKNRGFKDAAGNLVVTSEGMLLHCERIDAVWVYRDIPLPDGQTLSVHVIFDQDVKADLGIADPA